MKEGWCNMHFWGHAMGHSTHKQKSTAPTEEKYHIYLVCECKFKLQSSGIYILQYAVAIEAKDQSGCISMSHM